MQEVPYFGRGDMIKQINKIRAQFKKYSDFGQATINDVFTPEQLDSALSYKANYMHTSYIENMGDGKFNIKALPLECQIAPVYGMLTEDFDGDGNLDVLMVGNDFGFEVLQGRMDAFKGLFLKGDGKGNFEIRKVSESGFYVPGDAKALAYLLNENGDLKVIATQNKESMRAFKVDIGNEYKVLNLQADDFLVEYEGMDGNKVRRETYYGHSFLSQSSRRILIPAQTKSVEITNYSGESRLIE